MDPPEQGADDSAEVPGPLGVASFNHEMEFAGPLVTGAIDKSLPPAQFDAAIIELQSGIQRLCDNAVRVLQPCPEAIQVHELLCRAGALLQPDPLSRSIKSSASCN